VASCCMQMLPSSPPPLLLLTLIACARGLTLTGGLHVAHSASHAQSATYRPKISMKATPSEDGETKKKMGIDWSGLGQLVAMGAGAPMLGELKETNFNDPTKPDLMFELEANNFFDKEGNIQKGKYFDSGWTDEDATEDGPGFWENLFSGGKLQREADKRRGKQ